MTVLDASVLIAALNAGDAHHIEAADILTSIVDGLVHPMTMAEVLVGAARAGRAEELYADLLEAGLRVADVPAAAPVRLAALRATSGLRLPDCCVLELALAQGRPLATFDHALARVARRRGVEVIPATAG